MGKGAGSQVQYQAGGGSGLTEGAGTQHLSEVSRAGQVQPGSRWQNESVETGQVQTESVHRVLDQQGMWWGTAAGELRWGSVGSPQWRRALAWSPFLLSGWIPVCQWCHRNSRMLLRVIHILSYSGDKKKGECVRYWKPAEKTKSVNLNLTLLLCTS